MAVATFQKKEYTVFEENESGTVVVSYLKNDNDDLSFRVGLVQTTRVNGKNESKSFDVSVPSYLGNSRKSPWKKFASEEIRDLAFMGLYDSMSTNGKTDRLVFNDLTFQQGVRRKDDGTMSFRRTHVHTKIFFHTAAGKGGESFATNLELKPVSAGAYSIIINNTHESVRCTDGLYRRPIVRPEGLRGFARLFSECLTRSNLGKEWVSFNIPLTTTQAQLAGFTHWTIWFRVPDIQASAIALCQLRTQIARAKFDADELSVKYAQNNWDKNSPEYKDVWAAYNALREHKATFTFSPVIIPTIKQGDGPNASYTPVEDSLRADAPAADKMFAVICPSGKAPSTIFASAAADAARPSGQEPMTMAEVD